MDDSLEFTDDEIREELGKLGYSSVPDTRLAEFKKDLGRLIRHEKSKQSSQNTTLSSHVHTDTSVNDPRIRVPEPRSRVPLEESPVERQITSLSEDRRQYAQWRSGKENREYPARSGSPQEVHHIPRRPDADYSLYENDADHSQLSQRDDISETDSERRMMKRKVLRKEKDGSKRVDESMTESDLSSLMDINERLRELGIGDTAGLYRKRPQTAPSQPPYRLAPDDPRPASVILRRPEHPHTRNIKKTDPVARYQQFRQSWDVQRAPGEKKHKNLRWNVREQMLAQDVVYEKKPHRVFVQNNYKVPSEKKRQNLRWQIRTDMAQGQLPHHGFYPEY